jgi:hypothetical protein
MSHAKQLIESVLAGKSAHEVLSEAVQPQKLLSEVTTVAEHFGTFKAWPGGDGLSLVQAVTNKEADLTRLVSELTQFNKAYAQWEDDYA